ncbi:tyrosine--tRNA ligase [Desertivibrio insolitus]|uniref:tyrosine--tRNA ligase n=1 Tax=Herbiconiux sp. SYSU D00978 TaxID=2812562 RepID=UPI001A9613D9|nr:tyrosine--tRNA ligase [Herbiconiux sp. SYSU D00978]
MPDAQAALAPLRRTIDEIVGEYQLLDRLASGRQLRIKYGVDCTAPHLHLGHAVNLWMMRSLQDQGHRVIFLLGDLTTRIGDPSGRSETRPTLPPEAIEANAQAFLAQASLVLRTEPELLEVRRNSEWYDRMPVPRLLELFALTTQAQLMARDMFRQRVAEGREIALHELVYPVLQGFDSVEIDSDLTIVGSDQLFNELMGRHYQQRLGREPQTVITSRITPGLDGGAKQSKSLGNYVALTDSPDEKFGKLMSLRDELVEEWAAVYTALPDERVAELGAASRHGGRAARDAKLVLAEAVVARHHDATEASGARRRFVSVFAEGAVPDDLPVVALAAKPLTPLEVLTAARPELSNSARRRLLAAGAVRLDGRVLAESDVVALEGREAVLRTGPRTWARLTPTPAAG